MTITNRRANVQYCRLPTLTHPPHHDNLFHRLLSPFNVLQFRRDFRLAALNEEGEVIIHPVLWKQDLNVIDFVSNFSSSTKLQHVCVYLSIVALTPI